MGTFKIRHKSNGKFSAFSETKNHKIDEPKVEMVRYDWIGYELISSDLAAFSRRWDRDGRNVVEVAIRRTISAATGVWRT